jgi:hypothetical protein
MIQLETTVILKSGEALSAAEIFEGLVLLAEAEATFPLLDQGDQAKAVIAVAFEALEWARESRE